MWVPAAKAEMSEATEKILKGNGFASLAAETETRAFCWQEERK